MNGLTTVPPPAEVEAAAEAAAAVVVVVVVVIRPSGYLVSSVTVWVPFGLFTTVFVIVGSATTGSDVTTAGAEAEATAAGAYSGFVAGGNSVVALLSTSTTSD